MLNKDVTKLGWAIVCVILVIDGARLAATGQLWGRIRLPESVPVSEGWHIVVLGIVEAIIGLYVAYRLFSKH